MNDDFYFDQNSFAGVLINYIPAIQDMFNDHKFMKSKHFATIDYRNGSEYCTSKILEVYRKHYLTKTRRAKLIKKYVTG